MLIFVFLFRLFKTNVIESVVKSGVTNAQVNNPSASKRYMFLFPYS